MASSVWRFRPLILSTVLSLAVGLAACSSDSDPTSPDPEPGPPANTPDLPTVANPSDELPAMSDMLAVEDAPLGNFSPEIAGAANLIETLNVNSLGLTFRFLAGRCQLVEEGATCLPGALQWRYTHRNEWYPCTPARDEPCLDYLGEREGSHYYGIDTQATWFVQDLNARLAGGDLVTINSAAENSFVHGLRNDWRSGHYLALGMYDWGRPNNDWAWRSGQAVTYTSWNGGEPNNSGGEYFVMMASTNAGWNDYPGVVPIYAILESDTELEPCGEDRVPVLKLGNDALHLQGHGEIAEMPRLVRKVYWSKVFQATLGPSATYSQEHEYTRGTSETNGMSFGWSIGISSELGWGPVSVEISSEFHQDFEREVTVREEETVRKHYECTAPSDETVMFAVWQLRERFYICDSTGEIWSDPEYALADPLPYLDQGLNQEYLQTIHFGQ